MNVWITDEPFPASPEVEVEAAAAGADQILHGIPPRWVDVIPPGTLGVFELPDPEPYTPDLPADPDLIPPDPTRLRSSR